MKVVRAETGFQVVKFEGDGYTINNARLNVVGCMLHECRCACAKVDDLQK